MSISISWSCSECSNSGSLGKCTAENSTFLGKCTKCPDPVSMLYVTSGLRFLGRLTENPSTTFIGNWTYGSSCEFGWSDPQLAAVSLSHVSGVSVGSKKHEDNLQINYCNWGLIRDATIIHISTKKSLEALLPQNLQKIKNHTLLIYTIFTRIRFPLPLYFSTAKPWSICSVGSGSPDSASTGKPSERVESELLTEWTRGSSGEVGWSDPQVPGVNMSHVSGGRVGSTKQNQSDMCSSY